MSDTPRTDALYLASKGQPLKMLTLMECFSHAQQLERELSAAKSALETERGKYDRNAEGLSELVGALAMNQPIWPNPWGQDTAFVAFYIKGLREKEEAERKAREEADKRSRENAEAAARQYAEMKEWERRYNELKDGK